MTRLIQRNEFEKRLADYSAQLLKTLKRVTDHMAEQDRRIADLELRCRLLEQHAGFCFAYVPGSARMDRAQGEGAES